MFYTLCILDSYQQISIEKNLGEDIAYHISH